MTEENRLANQHVQHFKLPGAPDEPELLGTGTLSDHFAPTQRPCIRRRW